MSCWLPPGNLEGSLGKECRSVWSVYGSLVQPARCLPFPAGELVLWGATLWDPRVPVPLHTFDQLSSGAGGTSGVFHPNGGEILLNSEVRLRTPRALPAKKQPASRSPDGQHAAGLGWWSA